MAETKDQPTLNIKKVTGTILVDGNLDESDWASAEIAGDFFQNFPADTSYGLTKTEVKVTYDDLNIYIAATCYDELPGDYVIQSLKRDFDPKLNDAFVVIIDPFNDKINGFTFAVNPLGVQGEGLIEGGGFFGSSRGWDNKWRSVVKRLDDRWVVEIAIPLKTLRFSNNNPKWSVNFARIDLKRNEKSSWAAVPRNFNLGSTAFTGTLLFETAPKKPGTNIAIIPYVIGGVNQDYQLNEGREVSGNGGMDAKIAVTSSLNLDITINPDFSQVEVDRQIVNLTRFSLFFPEKRQFFIENSDLFSQFGFRQIRPFFSRNIGLNQGRVVPILAGARLSGKVNNKLRMGLMSLQTEGISFPTSDTTSEFVKSQNYSVAVFEQRLFGRSNIKAIMVNRQAFDNTEPVSTDYNRILGLDFVFASKSNEWMGKVFYHEAFSPENYNDNFTHGSWLMHNSEKVFAMWNHEYVGENYVAEVGFVPRNQLYDASTNKLVRRAYWRWEPMFGYKFYPKSGKINFHGPQLYFSNYFDSDFNSTEHLLKLEYGVEMKNSTEFRVEFFDNYIVLPFATDIARTGGLPLPVGAYRYQNFLVNFESDRRAKGFFELTFQYGSFFNGTKASYQGTYGFRKQPWGIFSLDITRDEILLPYPYENASLTLIGPKVELSFTKSLFFTTFIQYNTQQENVNINSRLQWRFKPMSDLYVVYTENYLPPQFNIKNRALVIKLIYWLNV